VKLFIVRMSRRIDIQWIRIIEVVLEPSKLNLTKKFSQGNLFYRRTLPTDLQYFEKLFSYFFHSYLTETSESYSVNQEGTGEKTNIARIQVKHRKEIREIYDI